MQELINRRKWLAAAGFATFAACGRNKGAGYSGYALVANAGDNSLVAIDLITFRIAANLDLGSSPSKVLPAPAGRSRHQAYAISVNGAVHAIDSERGTLKVAITHRLADHLSDFGIAMDGKSLLALSPHSNELIQADLQTLASQARHKFSIKADKADFSSNGYVAAASFSGAVELLHLSSGQRTKTLTPRLGQVRFRKDGKLLLVANLQDRSLLILDVPTLRTVAELPLAMQPDHLCFNSDQGQLFVSGEGMDGVAVVFPFNMLEVDQTLLAGRDPGTMACSALPAFLFVASRTGSDLCILNIDTRKVVGFVETGGQPSFITVTPDSQFALVLDEAAGDMGVIRVPRNLTGTERRLKTGASLFTMISVGSRPVYAAVIRRL